MKNTLRRSCLTLICAFALYACQQEDEIAPRKPALPACGKSVVYGYTDKTSYSPGEIVSVFLQSTTSLQCGLGFYDIEGKLVFTGDVTLYPQTMAKVDPWKYGYSFYIFSEIALPKTLPSGIYFIENQIPFVVKSFLGTDVTVVYPTNTFCAYNASGGKSLYGFNSTDYIGSSVVSFARPLIDPTESDRCTECLKWFRSLTDITFDYISDTDLDNYSSFSSSKVLVIAGHSEYWTRKARNNFDKFVGRGGHAVLLSGNSMWWQVRYSDDHTQLICYRDPKLDPEPDPLLKTIRWVEPLLDLPIVKSIGADFDGGGYGLRADKGWNGYKIVNPNSPLFEGLTLKRGDVISVPSDECDGAPIKGFDADGFPILDNKYNFEKFELLGFDRGSRGGAETFPTFTIMKATATSGVVVNMGASDWCALSGVGHSSTGHVLKTVTKNTIQKLRSGSNVFSN